MKIQYFLNMIWFSFAKLHLMSLPTELLQIILPLGAFRVCLGQSSPGIIPSTQIAGEKIKKSSNIAVKSP